MNRPTTLRRILLAPSAIRSTLLPLHARVFHASTTRQYAVAPNVAQTSFWLSLIPKPLRGKSATAAIKKKAKSKEWNPATFFIFIFLLIGSMSIQMIALRNDFAAFSRRADAKIGLLKEIIGKIQAGEEVDVEGLLGTGDAKMEKEWEEVLQEIEQEDEIRKRASEKREPVQETEPVKEKPKVSKSTNAPRGFY